MLPPDEETKAQSVITRLTQPSTQAVATFIHSSVLSVLYMAKQPELLEAYRGRILLINFYTEKVNAVTTGEALSELLAGQPTPTLVFLIHPFVDYIGEIGKLQAKFPSHRLVVIPPGVGEAQLLRERLKRPVRWPYYQLCLVGDSTAGKTSTLRWLQSDERDVEQSTDSAELYVLKASEWKTDRSAPNSGAVQATLSRPATESEEDVALKLQLRVRSISPPVCHRHLNEL